VGWEWFCEWCVFLSACGKRFQRDRTKICRDEEAYFIAMINPEETCEVMLTLKNEGVATTAKNITAQLFIPGTFANVVRSKDVANGDIPAGKSRNVK